MKRTNVNPVTWSTQLGFSQGQLFEGHARVLVCSGQDAVDSNGGPQHPGDIAGQIGLAVDNLEAILGAADMTLADVVRLDVFTTDMDDLLANWKSLTDRLGGASDGWVTSLLGVTQLAAPGLLVLLEATAVG